MDDDGLPYFEPVFNVGGGVSVDPVVQNFGTVADEELAIGSEDVGLFGVQMAEGDGSMIASCLLSCRGVSAMHNSVASFPHGEERLPSRSDDRSRP